MVTIIDCDWQTCRKSSERVTGREARARACAWASPAECGLEVLEAILNHQLNLSITFKLIFVQIALCGWTGRPCNRAYFSFFLTRSSKLSGQKYDSVKCHYEWNMREDLVSQAWTSIQVTCIANNSNMAHGRCLYMSSIWRKMYVRVGTILRENAFGI